MRPKRALLNGNRTLKNRMYRYFTYKSTLKFLDVLSKLVRAYNSSYHRRIKMTPSEVNSSNEREVWKNIYGLSSRPKIVYKFNVGDQVRIAKTKMKFEKGYLPNFSDEIFTIVKRYSRDLPVYVLKDYNDETIKGSFYEAELQRVRKPSDALYRVEEVLKKRKRKGNTQYFVKWQGWDGRFNSWVDDLSAV